jgi:hypothetical protein
MAEEKKFKMILFEYAIVYNPLTKEGNESEAQIIKVDKVLAKNDKTLSRRLIREIPEKWDAKLDDIDIWIRPFSK